jgi:hypothetical protein
VDHGNCKTDAFMARKSFWALRSGKQSHQRGKQHPGFQQGIQLSSKH